MFYYLLGFSSNNPLKDGRYRHLKVLVNRPDLKLDFRSGYYADRDFEHLNHADREQQLEDELAAQLPRVDVPLYGGVSYFRKDESHYYLSISLVVPGSQIPFVTEKDKDNATIDVIGEALADAAKGKITVSSSATIGPPEKKDAATAKSTREGVRVLTNIQFMQGTTKIYESKPLVANDLSAPDRKAVTFQIDFPLEHLKPGFYLCQVNVIDDFAGSFSFPRFPILVRANSQPSGAN